MSPSPALYRILKGKPEYLARLAEVRAKAKLLASYIPQTFPHYTQHTVEHSDEIIHQISRLLYTPGKTKPALRDFSPTEGYLVAVSAYLHDLGMVVSDAQKMQALRSDEWNQWLKIDPQLSIMTEIDNIRHGRNHFHALNPQIRGFLADHQFRQLVAEYFRRMHHARSASIVYELEEDLGGFSFGNHQIKQAVAAICKGHGLNTAELEDDITYPMDTDINGDPVNLRLLAILLRLGDLLDLRHDRACPLLLNAAAPLPIGSYPHWSQFSCLTEHTTRPDRIKLSATCHSIEEHRTISDWCGWIEAELQNALKSVHRFTRHSEWRPPHLEQNIRSDPKARYIWRQWKLKIDEKLVLDRLIFDAYPTKVTFTRELLQNALDANRCHLNRKLPTKTASKTKKYPNLVAASRRRLFPILIGIKTIEYVDSASGVPRSKVVFSITDSGIGMTRQVIEDYFLQVGRSWYESDHFRKNYECSVTSQFGIGFLSVFAVSENVVVDTLPYDGADEGTRMILTGPRNYILTEKSTRANPGTTIEVELREPITAELLWEYVTSQCTQVEFPVIITDGVKTRRIDGSSMSAPAPEAYSLPTGKIIRKKTIPIEADGMFGDISFYIIDGGNGSESWCSGYYFSDHFVQENPGWPLPPKLRRQKSYHGLLLMDESYMEKPMGWNVDCRRKLKGLTLSRGGAAATGKVDNEIDTVIRSTLNAAIKVHLETVSSKTPDAQWRYTCQLISTFNGSDYRDYRVVKGSVNGRDGYYHARDVTRFVLIAHANDLKPYVYLGPKYKEDTDYTKCLAETVHIRGQDLTIKLNELFDLPDQAIRDTFSKATLLEFAISWPWVCMTFDAKKDAPIYTSENQDRYEFVDFPDENIVGFTLDFRTSHYEDRIFLNKNNPLIRWIAKVWPKQGTPQRENREFGILLGLVKAAIQFHGFPNEDLKLYLERCAQAKQYRKMKPPPVSDNWCIIMKAAKAKPKV